MQQQAVGYLVSGPVVEGRRRNELHLKNVTAPYDVNFAETGIRCIRLEQKPSWRVDLDAIRIHGHRKRGAQNAGAHDHQH